MQGSLILGVRFACSRHSFLGLMPSLGLTTAKLAGPSRGVRLLLIIHRLGLSPGLGMGASRLVIFGVRSRWTRGRGGERLLHCSRSWISAVSRLSSKRDSSSMSVSTVNAFTRSACAVCLSVCGRCELRMIWWAYPSCGLGNWSCGIS